MATKMASPLAHEKLAILAMLAILATLLPPKMAKTAKMAKMATLPMGGSSGQVGVGT